MCFCSLCHNWNHTNDDHLRPALTRGCSTMVEYFPCHPGVKGLSPATVAGTGKEKSRQKKGDSPATWCVPCIQKWQQYVRMEKPECLLLHRIKLIRLFWCKLTFSLCKLYRFINVSNICRFEKRVKICQKSFIWSTLGPNVIKNFTDIIYGFL
jgi:hypothetical protein